MRQVSANSCVSGSPGCDHLPVDQDDPEKRIAELERVPGEPSVAARKRPGIEHSLQFSDSDTQPIALPGVVTDRHARRRALWAMHAQRGQAMAAQAARKQRRSHRTEKLIGWIFVVVAGVLGIPFVAAVVLAIVVPSSTQWMSGIVCSSPYHLEHDISHHSYKPGQSTSTVTTNVSAPKARMTSTTPLSGRFNPCLSRSCCARS